VIYAVARGDRSFHVAGHFAQNGWGSAIASPYGLAATAVVEIVGTALLVAMVLATTRRSFPPAVAPIAVGLTLALIHIVTIGVDSTGVNPARSVATAVFAGGDALSQLWAFVVFPALGALLGVGVHLVLDDGGKLEAVDEGAKGAARYP
jgi:aquaporin Z